MIFDKNVYFSYLKSFDAHNAQHYLYDCVPEYLYKYYALFDENEEENYKRIKTLSSNCNWYDIPNNQNDPLEMKISYVDKQLAHKYNVEEKVVEQMCHLLEMMQNSFVLCSFTETGVDNFPMWAFYSNLHKGYCVKYKVMKREAIFRVFYEPERIGVLSTLMHLYNAMYDSGLEKKETKELVLYRHIMMNILNCKHISWSNEKEHRIIVPSEQSKGINIKNEAVGIKPVELYLGINCAEKNRKELIDICRNNLSCKVYAGRKTENKFLEFTEVI